MSSSLDVKPPRDDDREHLPRPGQRVPDGLGLQQAQEGVDGARRRTPMPSSTVLPAWTAIRSGSAPRAAPGCAGQSHSQLQGNPRYQDGLRHLRRHQYQHPVTAVLPVAVRPAHPRPGERPRRARSTGPHGPRPDPRWSGAGRRTPRRPRTQWPGAPAASEPPGPGPPRPAARDVPSASRRGISAILMPHDHSIAPDTPNTRRAVTPAVSKMYRHAQESRADQTTRSPRQHLSIDHRLVAGERVLYARAREGFRLRSVTGFPSASVLSWQSSRLPTTT